MGQKARLSVQTGRSITYVVSDLVNWYKRGIVNCKNRNMFLNIFIVIVLGIFLVPFCMFCIAGYEVVV